MSVLGTILIVFALVFEILATLGVPNPPRLNFVAAGLACYFTSILLAGVR